MLHAATGLIVVVTSAIGGLGAATSRSATTFLAVAGTGLALWGLDRTIPRHVLVVRHASPGGRIEPGPAD